MYVTPQLTDLGSFQELTQSGSIQAASGGVIGPIGSLVNSVVSTVTHQLPWITVDDNSHVGTDYVRVDPTITITPR